MSEYRAQAIRNMGQVSDYLVQLRDDAKEIWGDQSLPPKVRADFVQLGKEAFLLAAKIDFYLAKLELVVEGPIE